MGGSVFLRYTKNGCAASAQISVDGMCIALHLHHSMHSKPQDIELQLLMLTRSEAYVHELEKEVRRLIILLSPKKKLSSPLYRASSVRLQNLHRYLLIYMKIPVT